MNGAPSLDCCKASIFGSGKLSPQWQQKIAYAKNKYSSIAKNIWPRLFSARSAIFCDLLEVTIFRQLGTAIDACAAAIFTFLKTIPLSTNRKARCKYNDKNGIAQIWSRKTAFQPPIRSE
jgi:hypothetical protein